MRVVNDRSIEFGHGKNKALVAVTKFPMSLLIGVNCAICCFCVFSVVKSWMTMATILFFLDLCFNVLAFRMNNEWICAFVNGEFAVRMIAPPLLSRMTKRTRNSQHAIAFPLHEIQALGAQKVEIQEWAGSISTNWLAFDVSPDVMDGVVDNRNAIRTECQRLGETVSRLLRYSGNRCFLQWAQMRMPLDKFISEASDKFPSLSINEPLSLTMDVRDLATQPEDERKWKIRLLFDLGLAVYILPYLTARNGMSTVEAKQYAKGVIGDDWPI